MKYQIPQTVFIQEIDDEIILLDTTTQEYFSLNEVGKNIIDLISENLTKDEMVEELSNIYEVDRIQIEKDLINFAKLLEEKGLITID
ncbi:PqqD family protein [Arcobacter cloacae]|uniref:PqqD family protein n=1 Tax=Arcobacter cloacae TaxID=1054034 RepID=A0A4Q0ZH77_9BACT|nr:PqqD family protein [Arcobacter cloacae]RXJ82986.1 PqqD family protein [Arcobacter cloacae]